MKTAAVRRAAPPAALMSAGAVLFRRWIGGRKLTYAAVALQLKCSKSYVAMLSTGAAPPSLGLAARVEELTGIPCIAWTRPPPAE